MEKRRKHFLDKKKNLENVVWTLRDNLSVLSNFSREEKEKVETFVVSLVNILVWLSAPTSIALKLLDLAVIISTNSSPFVLAPFFFLKTCVKSLFDAYSLNWSRSFWAIASKSAPKFDQGCWFFLLSKFRSWSNWRAIESFYYYCIGRQFLIWKHPLVFVEYLMKWEARNG